MSKVIPEKTDITLQRIQFIRASAERTGQLLDFLLRGLKDSTVGTGISAGIHTGTPKNGCSDNKESKNE